MLGSCRNLRGETAERSKTGIESGAGRWELKRSQAYHDAFEQGKDIVDYEDAVREVEAQYECFVEMTKREPDYLAGHTVLSLNFIRALRDVASEHQIPYLSFDVEHEVEFQGQKLTPFMEDFSLDYDPVATLAHVLSAADKRPHVIPELICTLDFWISLFCSIHIWFTQERWMLKWQPVARQLK